MKALLRRGICIISPIRRFLVFLTSHLRGKNLRRSFQERAIA
jgi:hypothetical protein